MTLYRRPEIIRALTPKSTKYSTHKPFPKQQAFLLLNCLDAFYGGAAGGGKSDALLLAALQYVDVPGYAAILIRDTYANLAMPGALMSRAAEWLAPWVNSGEVRFNGVQYSFPSGATLRFGHMDGPNAHFNYQSAEFQFVGIDEVVSIPEHQALYMFSRLRRLVSSNVPIRFRCASNPPAREQLAKGAWVKDRYITGDPWDRETGERRVTIRAKAEDNPYLDVENYNKSLALLDPITREQLRNGDWDIHQRGVYMDRADFILIDELPTDIVASGRRWDMAATEPTRPGHDPDWTCGIKGHMTMSGMLVLEHCIRFRKKPEAVEALVLQTARLDGRDVRIRMEQEGGSSGKTVVAYYARLLSGWDFRGEPAQKNKFQRATPFMNMVGQHRVCLLRGEWNTSFLDECELFPDGVHDDQVDAASGLLQDLTGGVAPRLRLVENDVSVDRQAEQEVSAECSRSAREIREEIEASLVRGRVGW